MSIYSFIRYISIYFLPFVVALILFVSIKQEDNKLQPIGNRWILAVFVFIIFLLGITPATYFDGSDKSRYLRQFDNIMYVDTMSGAIKDSGWSFYVKTLYVLTLGNSYLYFLVTAFIYGFSFYYFAKKHFSNEYIGYYILMTVGLLGFGSFANNIIRNGVALAFCLYAVSTERKWLGLLLVIIAYPIHGSIIILIGGYIYTMFVKKIRYAAYIWIACLILCILNVDTKGFFSNFYGMDDRVAAYSTEAVDWVRKTYANAGKFRWDFLLYSVAPLYIANVWIRKYEYRDEFYFRIVNMYLLSNALWLLLMRQVYADRFALYSWIMIPIITLYPLFDEEMDVPNASKKASLIILIFLGVNTALALRTFF